MRFAVFATFLLLADRCPLGTGPAEPFPQGTWGGENVAVIVTDTAIHVHIGCTFGDAPRPRRLAALGRFDVAGRYNITAHPVDLGVFHPSRFTGGIQGRTMTLTVQLTDTTMTLGPVVVFFGREPRMGPCPICRVPGERR